MPDRYEIVAVADRDPAKTATLAGLREPGVIRQFDSDQSLFAAGKLADVLLICTQDGDHYGNAMDAMELGYDLLLEKPAAETLERCEELTGKRARKAAASCPASSCATPPSIRPSVSLSTAVAWAGSSRSGPLKAWRLFTMPIPMCAATGPSPKIPHR